MIVICRLQRSFGDYSTVNFRDIYNTVGKMTFDEDTKHLHVLL